MRQKIILILFFIGMSTAYAQNSIQEQLDSIKVEISTLKKTENSHFKLRGFAQFGLDASSDNASFNMTSFNPILLWRLGNKFLFESEIEMEYMDNQYNLSLGYANASYLVANGITIKVGKILVPFGVFGEKLHPSWVNKLSDAPLGLGHDNGMLPMADIGVEIRGGMQLGLSKLSYSVYAVNGPRIKDGTTSQTEAGMLSYENFNDNNKNKAIGSRIGFLPFSNSCMEIGFSAYYAKPGAVNSPFANDTLNMDMNYKDVKAILSAIDFSFVKTITPISGLIDIKSQYNNSNVSDATYLNPDTSGMIKAARYTFKNNSNAFYLQVAYRPTLINNNILKNIEFVGRYSNYNTPLGSLWYSQQSQLSYGINYWFSWRTVLKLGYQTTSGAPASMSMNTTNNMNMATSTINMFQIYLATGL